LLRLLPAGALAGRDFHPLGKRRLSTAHANFRHSVTSHLFVVVAELVARRAILLALIQYLERIVKHALAINAYPKVVDKNLANDLLLWIKYKDSRVGNTVIGVSRAIVLVENAESDHRLGVDVGQKRICDVGGVDKSPLQFGCVVCDDDDADTDFLEGLNVVLQLT
jgi:hypothetical protein